jgi:hypothetical protein
MGISGLAVDYTISIGNIIEIGSIIGGGFVVFLTLKNNVATLKDEVTIMKQEVRKLGDILVSMARYEEKLQNLDRRVTVHDNKIDELQHGDGFVRNRRAAVDGEYP